VNVHIFSSENLYSYKYLKFLEGNFDLSNSRFVFKKPAGKEFKYDDKLKERIFYPLNNIQFFFRMLPELRKSSKILFHQLPHGPALFFWNLFPGLLSKVTWIIWGGDVYLFRQARESLSNRIFERFRKMMIKKIPRIASFTPGDYEIIRKIYGTKAEYFPSMYPLPVDFLHFTGSSTSEPKTGEWKILAGNSGNPSNLHHEILTKLEPLKDSTIRIYCPLSYSGNPDYINSVEARGKQIFGGKFISMNEIMDPDRYLALLYDIDVAIMNHDRQQGLGNILPLLYFGKKVFMRSGTSSFEYLESIGCYLCDISSIDTFDESFFRSEQEKLNCNSQIIGDLLSEKRCRELWERILN
jgi:dTDP-N-acetylfucosamine:lipid II N-acetylfucosaminyltransferase